MEETKPNALSIAFAIKKKNMRKPESLGDVQTNSASRIMEMPDASELVQAIMAKRKGAEADNPVDEVELPIEEEGLELDAIQDEPIEDPELKRRQRLSAIVAGVRSRQL